MAHAVKCDRCGKCFDPFEMGEECYAEFYNPSFRNEKNIREHTVGHFLSDDGNSEVLIDLCPRCAEDFELFMDGYQLAVHDNNFDKPDRKEPTISISEIYKAVNKCLRGLDHAD